MRLSSCDVMMQLALKVDLQHEVFGLFENIHHQVSTTAPWASSFHRLILIPHHWRRISSGPACSMSTGGVGCQGAGQARLGGAGTHAIHGYTLISILDDAFFASSRLPTVRPSQLCQLCGCLGRTCTPRRSCRATTPSSCASRVRLTNLDFAISYNQTGLFNRLFLLTGACVGYTLQVCPSFCTRSRGTAA